MWPIRFTMILANARKPEFPQKNWYSGSLKDLVSRKPDHRVCLNVGKYKNLIASAKLALHHIDSFVVAILEPKRDK